MSERKADDRRYIVIPNWDEFQHYKDRDPKWVKNYTRLTADWNYLRLSFRLRGILHGIWLLYAASGRDLGSSPAQLGRMLGDESVRMRDLETLNHAGFIEFSDSKPLSKVAHPAIPEPEAEERKRKTRDVDVEENGARAVHGLADRSINGAKSEPTPIVALMAALTDADPKSRIVIRSIVDQHNLTEADLVEARIAAKRPDVRSPTAVAVAVLQRICEERQVA